MPTPEDLTMLVTSSVLDGVVPAARLLLPDKGDSPDLSASYLVRTWNKLSHGERSMLYTARDLALIRGRNGQVDNHLQSRIAEALRDLAIEVDVF